ncbi:molybdopterin-binding protein [Catelliglobosispora koreensis]|uniref:molybdopterin-binding protein n=1 Tax=Catelliglobosispora koreensis TaxID=129052 RepID=UPI00039B2D11|nr:molybdopterin-binding protein [Catelliglobosispora koreensis]
MVAVAVGNVDVAHMAWAAARDVATAVPAMGAPVKVAVDSAHGLALAKDVTATVASPPFMCAAMDGYAVRGLGPWRVVGKVLAGAAPLPHKLMPGEGAEIGTGAIVPDGTDAVIPYEQCQVEHDIVTAEPPTRRHIRHAGEDFPVGEVVASAGQRVTAAVAGVVAQSGVDVVWVTPQPSVWLIVTGDEVITSGVPVAGQVREAHTAVVAALTGRAGGVFAGRTVIGDDPQLLRQELEATSAKVVVVSGSSSAGRADHLREVLTGMGGRWLIDGVACRPGHPQGLGQTVDGRWVVSLPGNPFAGMVAGLTLLEPLVSSLAGRDPAKALRLPVSGHVGPYEHGVRLVPVTLDDRGGAVVIAGSRPGSLRAVARADAVAVIEPGWTDGAVAELLLVP